MPTNDEIIDKEEMEWIVPDDVDGREVLNRMLNKARAEGYEEGTYNDFIAFMHEYDLPDSQLTKGGQLFRDKLLAVRDRIYKKAQSDLFKELEDELNKKLNNQHFRTTDFKFIAGYYRKADCKRQERGRRNRRPAEGLPANIERIQKIKVNRMEDNEIKSKYAAGEITLSQALELAREDQDNKRTNR